MTMRTPSMVRLVSAIEVASTTLRRPGGAGAMARSCARAIERAVQRRDVDRRIGDALRQARLGAADLGRAGQEHQHRARLGSRSARATAPATWPRSARAASRPR